MIDDVSRSEQTGQAKPVIERSRETPSSLRLHDETTVPPGTEFVTVQHPD